MQQVDAIGKACDVYRVVGCLGKHDKGHRGEGLSRHGWHFIQTHAISTRDTIAYIHLNSPGVYSDSTGIS